MVFAIALYKLSEFIQALPKYLPIDDGYIILHFARNVVERHEFFSYNPGVISTGITSPLYCLALAAAHFFCGNGDASWPMAIVCVGTLSFIAIILMGSRFAYLMAGYPAALCFGAFFGFWGYMSFFALCGMEPILYIAVSFAAFLLVYHRNFFLAGLFTGLAMLCRPEAIFLAVILGLIPAISLLMRLSKKDWAGGRIEFFNAAYFGIGFLLAILPWVVRCHQISGGFMSSTVTMKTYPTTLKQAVDFWAVAIHMYNPASYDASIIKSVAEETAFIVFRKHVPLMLIAAFSLWFLRKRPELFAPYMYIPLHLLVAGLKNPGMGDNERYFPFDYAVTLLYLSALLGFLINLNWRAMPGLFRTKTVGWGLKSVFVSVALALAGMILSDYSRNIIHYRVMSKYFYHLDYQIGEWLAKNTPPETTVALFQAGGIAFFSRRRIIDGGGVTEHTIWPYLKRQAFLEAMVDRDADFVASFGPDWLKQEGVLMTDTRYFRQIPLACRGLYAINKPALRAFVQQRRQHPAFGPTVERSIKW